MFLRTKEDILSEDSQIFIENYLAESSYQREFSSLLNRLGFSQNNISLSEESFMATLNETSEDELKEKFEKLKKEVEKEKRMVSGNKNITRASTWWMLGMFLAAFVGSVVLISPLVALLGSILSIILGICAVVSAAKVLNAIRKLKGSLGKLKKLKDLTNDKDLKNKITKMEDSIKKVSLHLLD